MRSIAKKGLQEYLSQLQRHPLRTKVITAGVLSGVSDAVAQKITGIPKLQLRRLVLKVLVGTCYLGPFGHFMYILLDKIFKGKRDAKTVAKKVLLEQLTSSPLNHLLFMIYYGLILEVLASCGVGKSPLCATALPCHLPQYRCLCLGNILESASNGYNSKTQSKIKLKKTSLNLPF